MSPPSVVAVVSSEPAAIGTIVAYRQAWLAGSGIPTFMSPLPISMIGRGATLADPDSDESVAYARPIEIARPCGDVPTPVY